MPSDTTFDKLFLSLRGSLTRSLGTIVPPKEIEDIVQEAYVRICQVNKKESIRTPRSYLFRTVRHLALDYLKRSEARLTDDFDEDSRTIFDSNAMRSDETFDQVASDEEFAHFCDAVRHLPIQCRRAFVLKKVYGYSQREIAEKLGLSESTVEKHIALGIKRCTYFMHQCDKKVSQRENSSGSSEELSA